MTRNCTKCGELKALDDFNRHAGKPFGRDTWCRVCRNHYDRQRKRSPQYRRHCVAYQLARRRKHPAEHKASRAVEHAIERAELMRPPCCESCGQERRIVAHHWSYKPEHWLDVAWVCYSCHNRIHREMEQVVA